MDKKTILIIEDDTDLQDGLSFSLRSEGYQTRAASTVKEGLRIFHDQGCDLLLLDCNLPDGNGFDLCARIKGERDIPIFMLTARDTEMDEVKALETGMDDFMSKPFSLAVLKARIKSCCAGTRCRSRSVPAISRLTALRTAWSMSKCWASAPGVPRRI